MSNPSTLFAPPANMSRYDLAFQVCPIMLVGGIAQNATGGLLPIIALYGQLDALTNGTITDPNEFFARYVPLPGSTLVDFQVSTQPFANQQIASNAQIQNPLALSMLMICPVNQQGGYLTKLPTISAMQASLLSHIAAGGWFSIATPGFVYDNLLMTAMRDTTPPDSLQKQVEWTLDFFAPIITQQQATAAQAQLVQAISSGSQVPNPPTWSGPVSAAPQNATGLTGALQTFGGAFPTPPEGVA
jgi:hypothetical protein